MLPVAVAGGGPTGLALALMLHQAGIGCEVFDARRAGAGGEDRRVLALSHGSRQILDRLGAWAAIGATPISAIHVSQQGRLGRTLIEAAQAGVPSLGYVAGASGIAAALDRACADAGIVIHRETRVAETDAAIDRIFLRCIATERARTVSARLVAWAEGATGEGAKIVSRDYGQRALLAVLRTSKPAAGVAYERFTADGPIALLPLGQRYALVWAASCAECDAVSALDDDRFLARLDALFGGRFRFLAADARSTFPLALRYRRTRVAPRIVWLGNAAQTLHPVAGQGFNLALRDAAQLVRLLEDAADCGDATLLARHAAARRLDRLGAIGITDSLVRLFGLPGQLPAHARSAGLLALDLMPAARRFFARRMIFGARAW